MLKEGPVSDAKWSPTSRGFVVICGTMPAMATLYDIKAKPVFNFGCAHRSVVSWSPHGRFLCLAGFGNLAGDMVRQPFNVSLVRSTPQRLTLKQVAPTEPTVFL